MQVRFTTWIFALAGALIIHLGFFSALLWIPVNLEPMKRSGLVTMRLTTSDQKPLDTLAKKSISQQQSTALNDKPSSNASNHNKGGESIASKDPPAVGPSIWNFKPLTEDRFFGIRSDTESHAEFNEGTTSGNVLSSREHQRYGKLLSPEVHADFDEPTSDIYVPFLWRDANRHAKARAVIEQRDAALWLQSLTGEPMLRAILYEHLQRGDFYQRMIDFLNESGSRHYTLELRFSEDLDSVQGNATDVRVFERGLVIVKNRPTLMRQFPGVSLGDAHKERGDARERLVLSRLRNSPAYLMVLEDLPIRVRL